MNESGTSQLPLSVDSIRKSESRSTYSNELLRCVIKYFDALPDGIKEALEVNKVVIFFGGSIRRGSVTAETHDIDGIADDFVNFGIKLFLGVFFEIFVVAVLLKTVL